MNKPTPIPCQEENVIKAAIALAAKNNGYSVEFAESYFIEESSQRELIVSLVAAINELGYEIKKSEIKVIIDNGG